MIGKPIQTLYNGYKFRSRLEARWAVFFDACNIKYLYEPEGYDLGKEGWYLPDFWVPMHPADVDYYPGAGFFIEIKPTEPSDTHRCILSALSLATGHSSYLLWGEVGLYADGYVFSDNKGYLKTVPKESQGFEVSGFNDTIDLMLTCLYWQTSDSDFPKCSRISEATLKARQARFEHGETPQYQTQRRYIK